MCVTMSTKIFKEMSNIKKPHILIVEDDTTIAKMYQFKLENNGYVVKCAYNGKEGLDEAEHFKPDLIMLDLKMPVMSGDDMLKELRTTDWGSSIKIVVLTNISRDEAPSDIRFFSVERYIVKAHYTPSQVLEVVNELLRAKNKRAN